MIFKGFGQGFRRSTFSFASILGPLWAGGAGARGALFPNYYGLLGVSCGLLVFVAVRYIITIITLINIILFIGVDEPFFNSFKPTQIMIIFI